jgi:hypothetical protein
MQDALLFVAIALALLVGIAVEAAENHDAATCAVTDC